MLTDAQIAGIHAILDQIDGAETIGAAIDLIPETWERYIRGPGGPGIVGFDVAIRPVPAPDMVVRSYATDVPMGKGSTQLEAMRAAVEWLRKWIPQPRTTIDMLKDRAIALTLATEALNDVYVNLSNAQEHAQGATVNVEVQRLAHRMDEAQFAILKHFGRGDGNSWDDSHPLNEALWSGQATADQIRDYA